MVGERDEIEEEAESEGNDEAMSGEWRLWEREKERWEEEDCNWMESGEGDARSSDDDAVAMAEWERIENTQKCDKVG